MRFWGPSLLVQECIECLLIHGGGCRRRGWFAPKELALLMPGPINEPTKVTVCCVALTVPETGYFTMEEAMPLTAMLWNILPEPLFLVRGTRSRGALARQKAEKQQCEQRLTT